MQRNLLFLAFVTATSSFVACASTHGDDLGGQSDDELRRDGGSRDGAGSSGGGPRVRSVSVGLRHTCAILEGGRVKCWGGNSAGQLGLGDTNDRGKAPGEMGSALPFVDLGAGRKAVALALPDRATCALLDDGSVKCWGDQSWLGVDTHVGDEPGEMGDALAALALPGATKAIAAGYQHVCATLTDDSTRCFGGSNNAGQLGVDDTEKHAPSTTLAAIDFGTGRRATQLAPATYHTCALLDDRAVKCWGINSAGELGLGDKLERHEPSNAIDFGSGRTVKSLAQSSQPILATFPYAYGCVVLDNGAVKCWGFDSCGLGAGHIQNADKHRGDDPGEMGDALGPIGLGTGLKAKSVSVGMSLYPYLTMSCAVLDDESVKCWGENETGSLGVGDKQPRGDTLASMGDALKPINLGAGVRVKSVSVGSSWEKELTACAILDDDRLKCWGGNKNGKLGLGDTKLRGARSADMGSALPYVDLGP